MAVTDNKRATLAVGILGGMGPMATVEAFRRITRATPAAADQEHLHVIVDSDPSIPDRTEAVLGKGPSPLPGLLASAERLAIAGAELICMPCNTAHVFFSALQRTLPVPIVHMIVETAGVAANRGDRIFGLLATPGTVASGIYRDVFRRHGLDIVVPSVESQWHVSEAINLIKAGRVSDALEALLPTAEDLGHSGGRTLILACTEISLVSSQLASVGVVLDSLQVMVESTVDYALGSRSIPSRARTESGDAAPASEQQ